MPKGKEQGEVMDTRNTLKEPANNPDAGNNGTPEPLVTDINVDGNNLKVEVEPAGKDNKAKFRVLEGMPENASREFEAKISNELQLLFKKNQETARQLKQEKAELENAKNSTADTANLQSKIDRLEGLIEGLKTGLLNDNRGSENRNPANDVDPLLAAAGVDNWEDFDNLTPSEIARAQNKVQRDMLQELSKSNTETQKQYEERMLLTGLEAKGYTSAEFKSWAVKNGVPVTENTIGLFMQLKEANKPNKTPDELELYDQRSKIRQSIVSPDLSGNIPSFEYVPAEEKQRKEKVNRIKKELHKSTASGHINPAKLLGR